ncbi:MAG: hypothetical protein K1X89_25680 [Myxococcaceae bacterium]|nr:hypothetical protein [Myxococcaceae bacterium]
MNRLTVAALFTWFAACGPAPEDDEVLTDADAVSAELSSATIQRALHWFQANNGGTSFRKVNGASVPSEGRCELAVETSYGKLGKYATAHQNYLAHRAEAASNKSRGLVPPLGASVFYNTSADGHVAFSAGGGRIWSTSVNRRIGNASMWHFQNYLGWAWVGYGN